MHRQYGKILHFWMGPADLMVSISDHQILAQVIPNLHTRPKTAKKELGWLGKESPTFKSYEPLRVIRTKIMPLLTGESLKYLCSVGQKQTQYLLNQWSVKTSTIQASNDFSRITFDIIGITLFGQEFCNTELGQEFKKLFIHVLREAHYRSQAIIPEFWDLQYWRWKQSIARLHYCAAELIRERRLSPTINQRKDLLSLILNEKDENGNLLFSDQQARATVVTFVFAGFDTSASSLTWTCYLLTQHPDVQMKIQEELDNVLGNRLPEYEDLDKLSYLTCVIKEAMRLYPPVPEALRELESDLQIENYFIPKGANLIIPISTLHENEEIWQEPKKFLPERFTLENEKKYPRYAYLPFGVGSKSCMGARFAMVEIRLILSMILQRFSLELTPNQVVIPEMQSIILQPRYGLKLNILPRNIRSYQQQTGAVDAAFSGATQ